MIVMHPDGGTIYAENEDDRMFVSVLDVGSREVKARPPMPNGAAGITVSPDGRTVLVTDNKEPRLTVVDTATNAVTRHISLRAHDRPAQRVRWSPDGRYVLVTSMEQPLVTVLSDGLQRQETFETAEGPMGVAFHPDGETALVANHNSGRVSVANLATGRQLRDMPAGRGVETLAFY
jgi:YVTN family beta-propeller protein